MKYIKMLGLSLFAILATLIDILVMSFVVSVALVVLFVVAMVCVVYHDVSKNVKFVKGIK